MAKVDYIKKIENLKEGIATATEKLAKATDEAEKLKIQKTISELTQKLEEAETAKAIADAEGDEDAKIQLEIMDKYKVNEIYQNPSGSYFTSQNLAELSVQDKKEVKTFTRENVEAKLK